MNVDADTAIAHAKGQLSVAFQVPKHDQFRAPVEIGLFECFADDFHSSAIPSPCIDVEIVRKGKLRALVSGNHQCSPCWLALMKSKLTGHDTGRSSNAGVYGCGRNR